MAATTKVRPQSARRLGRAAERLESMERRETGDLHRVFHETHDRDAEATLVGRYGSLVRSMARRAARRNDDLDDLVQVALYGLIRALDRFDPDRGITFWTFGHATIDGELKRHRRQSAWVVHVPRAAQEIYLRVGWARDELAHQLGRQPTVSELATRASCSEADVADVRGFGDLQRPASLDQAGGDGGRTQEVDHREPGFEAVDRADLVGYLLGKLDEREREIVHLRFVKNLKQSEIAQEIGASQMHVSRVLRAALDRLRALALER